MQTHPQVPVAFRTPAGNWSQWRIRDDTSDWNTINSIGPHDEYHMPHDLQGWALDVGSHIGGVAVMLLIDNPMMSVVAIEALPENRALIDENAFLNLPMIPGLRDRLVVLEGAAGDGHGQRIRYGDESTEFGRHHKYIGSPAPGGDGHFSFVDAEGVSLHAAIAATMGAGFVWTKMDCEQCEYPFLEGATVEERRMLGTIQGEHHAGIGRIRELLRETHIVTLTGGDEGFGHFTAEPIP